MSEATKACSSCCAERPRSEFNRRAASRDGLQPKCRACEREAKQTHYELNRDRILADMRARNAADPERNRSRVKQWAQQNKGRAVARIRQWRDANPELVREWAASFARRHPDRIRANTARQRARRRQALVIPFTEQQLALRLAMFPGCWMCGGPKESVDHVKPLNKGGAHILANLRPACGRCNSAKGDRWPYMPGA